MNPLLTVVITSYNHASYITNALESVLNQSYQPIEIIVIDDGSTDHSVSLIKKYESRFKIIFQENKGVVHARNLGLKMAQGKYIAFVDSDDVLALDRFEKQVALLEKQDKLALVYSNAAIIDENNKILGYFHDVYKTYQKNPDIMLFGKYCFIPMITVTLRKSVFDQLGPFDGYGPLCDYLKWIEIAYFHPIYGTDEVLGCWRRHQKSTSLNYDPRQVYEQMRNNLTNLCNKHPDFKNKLGKVFSNKMSHTYFMETFYLGVEGKIKEAKESARKALKLNFYFLNLGQYLFLLIPLPQLIQKIYQKIKEKKLPW